MRRVVITGVGALTPCGNDAASSWDAVVAGRTGIAPITRFDASAHASRIAGEVKGLAVERWLDRKKLREGHTFVQYALVAARMAVEAARFEPDEAARERVGTLIGVGLGGMGLIEESAETLATKGPRRVSPHFIPAVIGNLAAGQVAMAHGLKGASFSTTSACASGAHAIGEALRMIRHGYLDACLAGGSEAAVSALSVAGFTQMRALSTRNDAPAEASRPFDVDRDGFVIAEGAGVLVLEEREAALARGAPILAEVAGYGASADAHHLTQPAPEGEGAQRAMRAALADAGVTPSQVDYLNAHGTSTDAGDRNEILAIRSVLGARATGGLLVSSTKSTTGHLLGAAGAVETIFTALALRDGVVPPTVNLARPLDEAAGMDLVPREARRARIGVAVNNAFGFGGMNASLVLRRAEA
jgi:3-oxoacyl-[acyl-carrier-protein] synthase II